jgi:hypothetical protein
LRAHVAGCAICFDVAAVAGVTENAREDMRADVAVPDSGRVWWDCWARASARPRPGSRARFAGSELRWSNSTGPGELIAHGALILSMAAVLFLVPAAWLAMRRQ